MSNAELMQELWRRSESSDDPKEKMLLEIAGNLIEAIFDTDNINGSINSAIEDAKDHLSNICIGG